MPVDKPIELAPGITHREVDFFADAQPPRGFMMGHDGSTPVGRAKGNHAAQDWPPRRALTGHEPFKNLRGGK